MDDIVEKILGSANLSKASEAGEKVRNYIGLLASTVKSKRQLEAYGRAYLKEMLKPDSRYSGL